MGGWRLRRLALMLRNPRLLVSTARWSRRAARTVRQELRRGRFSPDEMQRPPSGPEAAEVVVNAVLRASRVTCLTRALVRQQWFAAHGDIRDLLIGVTSTQGGFRAHAWIEGDPEWN